MASEKKVVLITGANRGVGFGLAEQYAKRGYIVVAAVRDLAKAPKLEGSIAVRIRSDSVTDAKEAVAKLETEHGITHLDIVIANAGIAYETCLVRDINPAALDDHLAVNVRGPLTLFQATYGLLAKGTEKKFVVISTLIAANSIDHWPFGAAYTISKSAVTFMARQIHFEEPAIISFSISPGWVDTDMGNAGAKAQGLEAAPTKLSDTLPGILAIIDKATREETSGYMWDYDGTKAPW